MGVRNVSPMKTTNDFDYEPSMRMACFIPDNSRGTAASEETVDLYPRIRKRKIRREIRLRPGLWISIIDCFPDKRITFRYDRDETLLNFGFVMAGSITNKIRSTHADKIDLENHANMGGIVLLPAPSGLIEIDPGKKVQILHVHVDKEFFLSKFQWDLEDIHPELRKAVESDRRIPFIYRDVMSPSIRMAVHQAICGVQPGIPETVFFEGKALELVSLQLGAYNQHKGRWARKETISPDEREKIFEAAKLLVGDLDAPPKLDDLAKSVNLGLRKLQTGFRDIFDTSVFGFLRNYKMQKARLLFLETSMNVSEVAWKVGYINVSHFSAAYKRRFGILPKRFILDQRGR